MRQALFLAYAAPTIAYLLLKPFVFGLSVRYRLARVQRLTRAGRGREALRVLDRLEVEFAASRRKLPHRT